MHFWMHFSQQYSISKNQKFHLVHEGRFQTKYRWFAMPTDMKKCIHFNSTHRKKMCLIIIEIILIFFSKWNKEVGDRWRSDSLTTKAVPFMYVSFCYENMNKSTGRQQACTQTLRNRHALPHMTAEKRLQRKMLLSFVSTAQREKDFEFWALQEWLSIHLIFDLTFVATHSRHFIFHVWILKINL